MKNVHLFKSRNGQIKGQIVKSENDEKYTVWERIESSIPGRTHRLRGRFDSLEDAQELFAIK